MDAAGFKIFAIRARLNGVWDHPALELVGELHHDMEQDIRRIIDHVYSEEELQFLYDHWLLTTYNFTLSKAEDFFKDENSIPLRERASELAGKWIVWDTASDEFSWFLRGDDRFLIAREAVLELELEDW